MLDHPAINTAILACALIGLGFVHTPVAYTQELALEKAIEELFKKNDYSPSLFPVGSFSVNDVEPLLVYVAWNTVRPDLNHRARFSCTVKLVSF
jgi:hypothetical protein